MRIKVYESHSAQIGKPIKIALDEDAPDPYRDYFKSEFPLPMVLSFLLEDMTGYRRFLDVGANIGHFTLSAGAMGLDVMAIEAQAANYLLLARSISENGFGNVKALHLAASNQYAILGLVNDSAYASISATAKPDTPALPLDDVLPQFEFSCPDLIKIDVEGHEIQVLQGLRRTIDSSKPIIIFEGNNWSAKDSGGYAALLREVESINYQIYMFNDDGTIRPMTSDGIQEIVCVDYLAIPSIAAQTRRLPVIREIDLNEKLRMMERDAELSDVHRWHIKSVLDRFQSEHGINPRIEALRSRVAGA